MPTYLYKSRRGVTRAEIEGTSMQLIVGMKQARIYEGAKLVATVKLGQGERMKERYNRPNVCLAHRMPLVGRTKKCKTPDAPLLPGMNPVECKPSYDRALAVTRTKTQGKGWTVHSVPAPVQQTKLITATDGPTIVRDEKGRRIYG
jgi:hypothetical protein